MELIYEGKRKKEEILNQTVKASLNGSYKGGNLLVKGNNLHVLRAFIDVPSIRQKVDLIYIDPPFSTDTIFTIGKDRVSTISLSGKDEIAYSDNLKGPEYLEFIRERIILAYELLSANGSLYFHIDYKIGHYIKIILDEIFGPNNFKNDITRIKCNPKNFDRKAYGNIKDMILFYTKGKNPIWNNPTTELTEDDIAKLFKKRDKQGRAYTTIPLHAPGETKNGPTSKEFKGVLPPKGRHWRTDPKYLEELDSQGLIEWSDNGVPRKIIYADEKDGKKMQDIWDFKDYQYPVYPTEKNIDLLKTIISASSNEDSLVLDFFCGSGTTLIAAQSLNRNWIGIDQSDKAIHVFKDKISKLEPELFKQKEFQFLEEQ